MHNGRTTEADIIRLGLLVSSMPANRGTGFIKREYPPPPRSRMQPEGREAGRNEPCPCGSGLKYKKCCKRKR